MLGFGKQIVIFFNSHRISKSLWLWSENDSFVFGLDHDDEMYSEGLLIGE